MKKWWDLVSFDKWPGNLFDAYKALKRRIWGFFGYMFTTFLTALLLFPDPATAVVGLNTTLFILMDEYLKEGYWFDPSDLLPSRGLTHEKLALITIALTALKIAW